MVVMQTRLTGSRRVGGQLDVVQLGELAAVVGRDVLLELLERLPAQVRRHRQGGGPPPRRT